MYKTHALTYNYMGGLWSVVEEGQTDVIDRTHDARR